MVAYYQNYRYPKGKKTIFINLSTNQAQKGRNGNRHLKMLGVQCSDDALEIQWKFFYQPC